MTEETADNDEPCMCGTPFTCLADEHDAGLREHHYDPATCRCICGALGHPDWGVTA